MTTIDFEGFFQCRLATDSDVYNHPRGQNGWTFAFANEPDLDRIIRFWDPVSVRSYSPTFGVKVTRVNGDPEHALAGAKVELHPMAVFEGHNGTIADATHEPISPCRWTVSKGRFRMERGTAYNVQSVAQRAPFMGKGGIPVPINNLRGMVITNPAQALAFREARRQALAADLATATNANDRALLSGRINALATNTAGAPIGTMFMAVNYEHPLKDAPTVSDPDRLLGATPDISNDWEVQYWMGCFDSDTHSAFVKGYLSIKTV